jgi:pyruvate kinase
VSASEDVVLEELIGNLGSLRSGMLALEARSADELARTHSVYRKSAENLLHYLSLRHHDVRPLQEKLALFGLSSLGRSEAMFWRPWTRCSGFYLG